VDVLRPRRLRAIRTAVFASIGVHGALVLGAALAPLGAPNVQAAQAVTMDFVDVVAPPPEEAPAAEAPPPPAARARAAPRAVAVEAAPAPEPAPTPVASAPADEAPAEPSAPVVEAAPSGSAPTGGGAAIATSTAGGTPGGIAGGVPGGTGTARPVVDEARRKVLLGRYRDLMRGRIGAAFRYPAQARDLELTGEVIVEVTVDRQGALRHARLRGACPHTLLCDDALRTVRAAAPFGPLPPDLMGDAVPIEIPLRYDFE
jgi:TonB family protein